MTQQEIIDGVSAEITANLQRMKREQYCPSVDADAMDEAIQGCVSKVRELRAIREQLEYTFTGAIK